MLTYLNIQNFAIIDAIELDLQPGMTVITGETGAGKSIIIDTLVFALGARADSSVIRLGAERAEVTAIFDVTKLPKALSWLIEKELDSENECIIRRSFNTDGRSKSSINGNPCPQQMIRELGALLIDIHGQHEYHELLKTDTQRELLDAFANNQELSTQVTTCYEAWVQAKKVLDNFDTLTEDSATKIDYVSHLIRELEALALEPDELENLQQELRLLHLSSELAQDCHNICEEDAALLTGLHSVKTRLEKYKNIDVKFLAIIDLFNNAIIQTQEANNEVRHYLDNIDFSDLRLQEIETRLDTIHTLARKHHIKPEELPQLLLQLQEQLNDLQHASSQKQQQQVIVEQKAAAYQEQAQLLSQSRQLAAAKLNSLVTAKIQTLGMNSKFVIQCNPTAIFSPHGLEHIEFQVATNPGQPYVALQKIASGGELSRISLAIQVIIATQDITPVLVFDEVDVGIGGKTAAIVGKLLKDLSLQAQVICVTHLPQVAIYGDSHMTVQKTSANNCTYTTIATLTKTEREQEIARMLGGIHITASTLAHAQEMLQIAKLAQPFNESVND